MAPTGHAPRAHARTLRMAAQVAQALDYAAERGLWHGSLNPDTIVLYGEPAVACLRECSSRVKPIFLNAAWIPFSKDTGGNQIRLDFDSAGRGCVGQIILFDHKAAMRPCLASDFSCWMDGMVSVLEAGQCVWSEEYECFEYPDDALLTGSDEAQ